VTVDVDAALAARFPAVRTAWDADLVILHHLGIGAAADGLDARSLRFVWEDRLVVLPSFAAIPGSAAAVHASRHPSIATDPANLLQGSHEIVLHRPLPAAATVDTTARIESVHDTGRAALVTVATETAALDGTPLATNRFVLLLRGGGGFGGDPPPSADDDDVADGPGRTPGGTPAPTRRLTSPVAPNQTALFRRSGDRTPLHIDPELARAAGFTAPPLPGLCTLGMVGRRIVEELLDGDPTAVAALRGRFAGPVYPGDTLVIAARELPHRTGARFSYAVAVAERAVPVLTGSLDAA
jgi:acyl dehydratase